VTQIEIRATPAGPAAFDVERPSPGDGEVVVATRAVALDASDLDAPTDHAIGCAFSGEIVEVGTGVERDLIGTNVVALGYQPCGTCSRCRDRATTACSRMELRGRSLGGGLAETVALDGGEVLPIPPGVSVEDAALTHTLARAVRAARRGPGRAGDHVAVLGTTPLALAMATVALAAGYGRVAHVGGDTAQAERGVRSAPTPTESTGWEELRSWLGGYGPDVAFECSGDPASRLAAIELVGPAGSVVLATESQEPVPMDINLLVMGDKRVRGARMYTQEDAAAALAMIEHGRVDVSALIAATTDVDAFLASAQSAGLSRSHSTLVRWPAERNGRA
jgi:threonine dehydrogenase-like Zn-dependent dehydrogenase